MGSPRDPPKTRVEPQNHLEVAYAASRESLEEKRVQMRSGKRPRSFILRASDLFGEGTRLVQWSP
jgi:hypothetical protein